MPLSAATMKGSLVAETSPSSTVSAIPAFCAVAGHGHGARVTSKNNTGQRTDRFMAQLYRFSPGRIHRWCA
jgi:hypothetical protein